MLVVVAAIAMPAAVLKWSCSSRANTTAIPHNGRRAPHSACRQYPRGPGEVERIIAVVPAHVAVVMAMVTKVGCGELVNESIVKKSAFEIR